MLAEEMHYPACAFPTQVTGGTWSSNFISSQKLPVSNNDLRQAHNGRRQYFIRNFEMEYQLKHLLMEA